MEPLDIEELVKSAQKGSDAAFYELITQRKALFYKTAFVYLMNEEDCLDVIQETVCKAYISIKKVKDPSKFYSWFTKILINNCCNYLKKNKLHAELDENIPFPADNIQTSHEELLDLHKSIEMLSEKHKTIIVLKYFYDMTLVEIADMLNCPLGTVKTNLHNALQELRIDLKEANFNG